MQKGAKANNATKKERDTNRGEIQRKMEKVTEKEQAEGRPTMEEEGSRERRRR